MSLRKGDRWEYPFFCKPLPLPLLFGHFRTFLPAFCDNFLHRGRRKIFLVVSRFFRLGVFVDLLRESVSPYAAVIKLRADR